MNEISSLVNLQALILNDNEISSICKLDLLKDLNNLLKNKSYWFFLKSCSDFDQDSLGYKSPVHDTIQETHACYNECMSFLMEKASNGSGIAVILATHNTDSGKLGARKASELGIDKENGKIEFAQLYGMSDALSLGLKRAGFNVSKYMPYGPVETAVPYLIRRAYENRGMMSTGALDRQLMRMELKRRIMAG